MRIFANGDATDGTLVKAMAGINVPVLIDIPRTTVLYRFVDLARGPSAVVANSPWWFEYEAFHNLRHFAERFDYDLDFAARLFLAILHEYSEITGFVEATVRKPLKAWKGSGRVQYGSGRDARDPARMIPMQGPNAIYQLYIPGLGAGSALFGEAFERVSYERLK